MAAINNLIVQVHNEVLKAQTVDEFNHIFDIIGAIDD